MRSEVAVPVWRREFISMLTVTSAGYLGQLEADTERDLAWWRSQVGTLPDVEWPEAVRTMIQANEDRLADILLERARRPGPA